MDGIGGALSAQPMMDKPETPESGPKSEDLGLPSTLAGAKLSHPFSHSIIQHHDDGSHTIHHIHAKHGYSHEQPRKEGDVRSGVGGHDEMLDHVMDHTGIGE